MSQDTVVAPPTTDTGSATIPDSQQLVILEEGIEIQHTKSYGIGIDCHSKFIQISVLVKRELRVYEYRHEFSTAWGDICAANKWAKSIISSCSSPSIDLSQPLHYCIESTSTYHLPIIQSWGGVPSIVNPSIAGSTKRKTNILDAKLLAIHDLNGIWPESFIPSKDVQELRAFIRERNYYSDMATRMSNRIANTILKFGYTVGKDGNVTKSPEIRKIKKDMASIQKRHGKYCVVYRYKGDDGKQKQKWETFDTMSEAKKRRKEIEHKIMGGTFVVPKCVYVKDLLKEYVELYGKDKWALSTYNGNTGLIHNYIEPMIGETKLSDVTTHFLEKFYQKLTTTPAIVHPIIGKPSSEFVGMSTIRDIHKLLRSCFGQAVKWELMEKNPADNAIVPKYKEAKREIWTAETLMAAMEDCDDDMLKLAVNLAFSASLRIGELLALTWDVMDISAEAIESDNSGKVYRWTVRRCMKVSTAKMIEKK